jgi:beta-fructofuranosidase
VNATSRRRFLAQLGTASTATILTREAWPQVSSANDSVRARVASDPLRPQFHLLPPANWMNDPNGPIFVNGRYHMFFQYNPGGAFWGSMHWAHASSLDMIHWHHEPIALAPTPGGYDRYGVFSGSAVLDGGKPTVIYTGVEPPSYRGEATLRDGLHAWREVQCLAVSDSSLRVWRKAPKPVIPNPPPGLAVTGFRDPCVWREGGDWMLALGSGVRGKGGSILLYRSLDLRRWTYLHPLAEGRAVGQAANPVDSGEMWECPDFFPLGDRYVLLISTMGKVFWKTGRYRDQRFHPEREGTVDFGAYYAAKSMLDRHGRRVLWGWIPERRPEKSYRAAGWAGVMSLPRILSLAPDGSLRMEPAPAVEVLRRGHVHTGGMSASKDQDSLTAMRIHNLAAELQVELIPERSGSFLLQLLLDRGEPFAEVGYKRENLGRELRLNRTHASLPRRAGDPIMLRLFLDGSVLELFANAVTTITERVYTVPQGPLRIVLQGQVGVNSVDLWQMQPIILGGDAARRSYWKACGGGSGLAYLVEQFVPRPRQEGFGESEIRQMPVENPARAFVFADASDSQTAVDRKSGASSRPRAEPRGRRWIR